MNGYPFIGTYAWAQRPAVPSTEIAQCRGTVQFAPLPRTSNNPVIKFVKSHVVGLSSGDPNAVLSLSQVTCVGGLSFRDRSNKCAHTHAMRKNAGSLRGVMTESPPSKVIRASTHVRRRARFVQVIGQHRRFIQADARPPRRVDGIRHRLAIAVENQIEGGIGPSFPGCAGRRPRATAPPTRLRRGARRAVRSPQRSNR